MNDLHTPRPARFEEWARTMRQLEPRHAARGALRAMRRRRRLLGLQMDARELQQVPIPDSGPLEATDALTFTAFADLVPHTPQDQRLEVLWYKRLAAEGPRTLVVARAADGRPTFSIWVLDARSQRQHYARFGRGFHQLDDDEMMIEGAFTFPDFRTRGVAGAGLRAACAWASTRGARHVWGYPYCDNPRIHPLLALCGFELRHARAEVSMFGHARGRIDTLTAADTALWAQAVAKIARETD